MESQTDVQLHELREEQQRLEEELGDGTSPHAFAPASTAESSPVPEQQRRSVKELGSRDVNTGARVTTGSIRRESRAASDVSGSAAHSPRSVAHSETQLRLAEIEKLRRKSESEARAAMSAYLHSQSDNEGYKERRASRLSKAQSFDFEAREMMKAPRIREQRAEEERRCRAEEDEIHQQFPIRAQPVPASTFMNKYDLMVEEWRQRRAAMAARAKEKARIAKEDAAYMRAATEGLRQTRETLMGAFYDPDGRSVTRSELRRRACSAKVQKNGYGTNMDPFPDHHGTGVESLALEVRMKFWPALSDHERVRRERIKQRATMLKLAADAEVAELMPSLMREVKMNQQYANSAAQVNAAALIASGVVMGAGSAGPCYGVGQVTLTAGGTLEGAPVAPDVVTGLSGSPAPQQPPFVTGAAPVAVPGGAVLLPQPGMAPPPPVPGSVNPTGAAGGVQDTVKPSPHPTATALQLEQRRQYNPQLTFKPNVRPGVPNFEALWARNNVELSEKKQRHSTTTPKPFDLTPSLRAEKIVARRPVRGLAAYAPPLPTRPRSTAPAKGGSGGNGAQTRSQSAQVRGVEKHAERLTTARMTAAGRRGTARAGSLAHSPPRGTRAHALRTESIYSAHVRGAKEEDEDDYETLEMDLAYWRGVAERAPEVRRRVAAYITDTYVDQAALIQSKVEALRAAALENDRVAEERLEEIKRRVAELPPVFAEPVHLNEESKARAESEEHLLRSLQDTGLDGRTIKKIIASPAAKSTSARASPPPPTGDGAQDPFAQRLTSTEGNAPSAADALTSDAAMDATKAITKETISSSSSDSDSDSDSSSSSSNSSHAKPRAPLPVSVPLSPSAARAGAPALPVPPTPTRKSAEYSDDSFEASSDSD